MLKSALRKTYRVRQKSLSAAEQNEKSCQIAARFFANFDLRQVNFLHCFLPIKKFNEIETKLIFDGVWQSFPHIVTLVPRVNFENGEIENLVFTSETNLIQNIWKIDEPESGEFVESEKIDLVLIPLLCFDARGFRVGYGKGFYDKFLSECREDCLKIGLGYFAPITEISDTYKFDIKLDFCITPREIFKFKTKEFREIS